MLAALFVVAVAHTFATRFFQRLAQAQPAHSGLWHLLGEVETAFGLWALVLMLTIFVFDGRSHAVDYLESRNFTEPVFVFVIMVIAGNRPILQFTLVCTRTVAQAIPLSASISIYFVALTLVPLLGSFITEPAAMTLAALVLRDAYYARRISNRLKYATIGALLVNVSIGGTLTSYAAPLEERVRARARQPVTLVR